MIRRPEYISKGSTIGITAPSFGCATEPYCYSIDLAIDKIKARGYNITEGKTARLGDGIGISTDPKIAAAELMEFYQRDDIDAIISAGGGELMNETVTHVDFEALKGAKPKWFLGYSDNTNFIFPMVTIAGVQGIYGPCISGFAKIWEATEEDSFALLEGSKREFEGHDSFVKPSAPSEDPESCEEKKDAEPEPSTEELIKSLAEYKYDVNAKKELTTYLCHQGAAVKASDSDKVEVSGVLLGGCLDVLANLVGTRLDKVKEFNSENKDVIWVLENCDLNSMSYRRALWNLREAGWFDSAKGFVIGRPGTCFDEELMGVNRFNAVTDMLAPIGVPIIMDADVGHVDPMLPLVMGAQAEVSAIGNALKVRYL